MAVEWGLTEYACEGASEEARLRGAMDSPVKTVLGFMLAMG